MKWYPNQLENSIKNGADKLPSLILVYGDDGGLVRRLAKSVADIVCPDDDPFMLDKLTADDIKNSPDALLSSAQTIGFGGGRKLITVDAGHMDAATATTIRDAIKSLLEDLPQDVVVVISAAGLDAKSAMAKAVEKHSNAAAVRCFLDSVKDLNTVINEKLAQSGQVIAADARQFLVDSLGNDRGITESEIDKLLLYTAGNREITLEDCLTTIAAAPSVTVFKLCDAIGLRDRQSADTYLNMLRYEGVDTNMMLAMVARHLRRLLTCQNLCAEGFSPQEAMGRLKPPVFMGKDDFTKQLKTYPAPRLQQGIERLYQIQSDSRKGLHSADDVISRGLLALSA